VLSFFWQDKGFNILPHSFQMLRDISRRTFATAPYLGQDYDQKRDPKQAEAALTLIQKISKN